MTGACVLSIGPLVSILHGLSLQILIQMCYPFSYLHASGTLAITIQVGTCAAALQRCRAQGYVSPSHIRKILVIKKKSLRSLNQKKEEPFVCVCVAGMMTYIQSIGLNI